MNHARTDWAFSIARRFLYEHADAVRLESLAASAYQPLADLAVKMRREETYHLLHFDLWLRRLAEGGDESRARLRTRSSASGPTRRPSSRRSPARPAWSPHGSCRVARGAASALAGAGRLRGSRPPDLPVPPAAYVPERTGAPGTRDDFALAARRVHDGLRLRG